MFQVYRDERAAAAAEAKLQAAAAEKKRRSRQTSKFALVRRLILF